ncbi:DUF429 domain-containing protein [Dictyobacter formicarum]|uniref:DUF429 domain-containing protein n=1 Tax=Dictyobacter formicarum TaxID=2778368 RepID=A0ABQ3VTA9_9CHLR|nr:DUF429 domain-containing protein [Dictyobacter formicarum]GHO89053.1 hypothetical protein KSZ_70590 [Dictyobacter formicarum]
MPAISIFGLDFTSAPSSRKPITCAVCRLEETTLSIQTCLSFAQFDTFEQFLQQPGPWLLACDFPFGQPRQLIDNLGWPRSWPDYVATVHSMGKALFNQTMISYSRKRPAGEKLHLRLADKLAGAISPMMMYRVPVGKMFFEGAPRLLQSGVSVLPCYPRADERLVVEGYPALVARRWLGKRSYKSDERARQTLEHRQARLELVEAICSPALRTIYGVQVQLAANMRERLIDDPMADQLDAALCAIQAAWAYGQRHQHYGIPSGFELDGWIVDPLLLQLFGTEYGKNGMAR